MNEPNWIELNKSEILFTHTHALTYTHHQLILPHLKHCAEREREQTSAKNICLYITVMLNWITVSCCCTHTQKKTQTCNCSFPDAKFKNNYKKITRQRTIKIEQQHNKSLKMSNDSEFLKRCVGSLTNLDKLEWAGECMYVWINPV